jgi:PKD repeat protein
MSINLHKLLSTIAISGALFASTESSALPTKLKVLFIGNSYTETNILPLLVRDVAFSVGDTVIPDWVTFGGYTFEQHSADVATIGKISIGDWNYVVLQEQSQRPAFSDADVAKDVFPYARKLDSLVHDKNKCGRSVFFQTWGYRDGDALNCPTFPPICTYKGMDSLLEIRYKQMAVDNEALLSPVGLVFREIRKGMPAIELYQVDGSHPTEAGSYAAAVTFYTILFGKDPSLIPFNYTLSPVDANFIRQMVRIHVYPSLSKFGVGAFEPDADFTYTPAGGNKIDFNSSSSVYVGNYNWNFGDGGTSILPNPSHTYVAPGTYTVRLIGDNCLVQDTVTQSVMVGSSSINENSLLKGIKIYPNPAKDVLNIESSLGLSNINPTITNLIGATIVSNPNLNNNAINIQSLSAGIYFLKLKDENSGETITYKFIKE